MLDVNQVYSGRAFSPGHITGLFQICDLSINYLKKGSRGAGVCISLGVTSTVKVITKPQTLPGSFDYQVSIILNGTLTSSAHTTKKTVDLILERCQEKKIINHSLELQIQIENELPVGQGFGLSGAGALSTALALNDALESPLSKQELLAMAHRAEVELGTGLGDVVAQSRGGVLIRVESGIPPYGELQNIKSEFKGIKIEDMNLVICVIGDELSTKAILTDPDKRRLINKYGEQYIKELIKKPSIQSFFQNSYKFALDSKLISPNVYEVIQDLKSRDFLTSMSMLGNSIFVLEPTDVHNIDKILKRYGSIYHCGIDSAGARVLNNNE
jgi:pantoate kinase